MAWQFLHSIINISLLAIGRYNSLALEQNQVLILKIERLVVTSSLALERVDRSADALVAVVVEEFALGRLLGHVHAEVGHVLSRVHAQAVPGLLADVKARLASGTPAQGLPLLGVVVPVPVLLEAVPRVLGAHELPRLVVRHHGGVGLSALVAVAVAVGHVAGLAHGLLQGLQGVDVGALVDLRDVKTLASTA